MEGVLHSFGQVAYIDILLRALFVYLFIVFALRVFGKKELAQLSVTDLVFILLISNAVQNAMVGPDTSLAGGIVAAATLFLVNFLLKKLLYANPRLNKVIQGEPLVLVYRGTVQEKNCIKAQVSPDELNAAIREHGVNSVEDVDLAMLEVDGNVSIISKDYHNRSVHGLPKKHKLKGRLEKR